MISRLYKKNYEIESNREIAIKKQAQLVLFHFFLFNSRQTFALFHYGRRSDSPERNYRRNPGKFCFWGWKNGLVSATLFKS